MKLSNKAYDVLKWVATYLLPGIGTLYVGLSQIWAIPYPNEIMATIIVIDGVLGAILGISTISYNGDGTIQIDTRSDDDRDIYRLVLNIPIDELAKRAAVLLKIDTNAILGVSEEESQE